MNDYPYVCRFTDLKELSGKPCRRLETGQQAPTVLVEFQNGEQRRVPTATIRLRKPAKREGA